MVTILHLTPADYQISTWSGGQTPNSSSLQKREVIQIGPLTFASLLQRWRLKKVILLISLATTES